MPTKIIREPQHVDALANMLRDRALGGFGSPAAAPAACFGAPRGS